MNLDFERGIAFRPGIPPEEGRYPGDGYSVRREGPLTVERNVAVRMRDGVQLYVDVIRPTDGENLPVLLTYSPYGKHAQKNFDMFKPDPSKGIEEGSVVDPGMRNGMVSHYTVWEGPDPKVWCEQGYAVVNADARGSWGSEGSLTFHSTQEGLDGYDLVEWAARQPWSNGRVGMAGVSYLAWSQWNVAATNPPHLCAINPWEGYTDIYRDIHMHGGMRETKFRPWWIETTAFSRGRVEDPIENARRHPFIDDYWLDRIPDLSRIDVPVYAVVDWGDHGIHTRGVIEGYNRISSKEKWLEVHGRLKWPYFYREESVRRQLRFFDHYLKEGTSSLDDWPRVNIEIRESYLVGEVRDEAEWPIERTEYRPYYLDAEAKSLTPDEIPPSGTATYDSRSEQGISFSHTFTEDTELTGSMTLKVWMSTDETDDMDVFVAVEKLNADGSVVGFPFQSMFKDGPVALGWLRATHRETDEELSRPWRPWHKHERALPVKRGEPTYMEIEIWPSCTLFRAGESVRLRIQGTEPFPYPEAPVVMVHEDTVNRGHHVVHVGGNYPSHLVAPVVGPVLS